mmetsp:Transcript_14097/g.39944  ORF Transcript_14097/g.39944 Transcript_14097/m.39944 type:complete len:214 (-) Transcript_14097:585-1226(-)
MVSPRLFSVGGGGEELRKAAGAHLLHLTTEQKAVIKSIELFALWELIGCRNQADERNLCTRAAVVEQPLVEDGEKGVEDGRVGLEDFVNERHIRVGKVATGFSDVLVLLQSTHRQRPKELLGDRETREKALKVAAFGQLAQAPAKLRLGSAWRPQVKDVLPTQAGEEQQADLGVALNEARLHGLHSPLQSSPDAGVGPKPHSFAVSYRRGHCG